MISQHLQCLNVLRVAADKPLQEGDLDIQLARFFPGQRFAFGTGLFRHTTAWIVSKSEGTSQAPVGISDGQNRGTPSSASPASDFCFSAQGKLPKLIA